MGNQLGVDYNIHGGTLLGWFRNCTLSDMDIDMAVSLSWISVPSNRDALNRLLSGISLIQRHDFGIEGSPGSVMSFKDLPTGKVKLDLFTRVEKVEPYKHYLTGLATRRRGHGTHTSLKSTYGCRTRFS